MTSWNGSWSNDGANFFDCFFLEDFDCVGLDLCLSLELLAAAAQLLLLLPVACTAGGAGPSLGLQREVRLF